MEEDKKYYWKLVKTSKDRKLNFSINSQHRTISYDKRNVWINAVKTDDLPYLFIFDTRENARYFAYLFKKSHLGEKVLMKLLKVKVKNIPLSGDQIRDKDNKGIRYLNIPYGTLFTPSLKVVGEQ